MSDLDHRVGVREANLVVRIYGSAMSMRQIASP
jgi:hypothetical protein